MKSKVIPWLFALVCILLFTGCSHRGKVEIQQLETDRLVLAHSVPELRTVSDVIVVFTPTSQENVLSVYSDGNVSSGYTKTGGMVSQVLKGDVSVGDTLWITEECYTTDDGTILWTQQGYLPMQEGESYLLFLTAYPEEKATYAGMYYPTELEYGKYVLPEHQAVMTQNSEELGETLELGPGGDLETYTQWYEEVTSLYPELFA